MIALPEGRMDILGEENEHHDTNANEKAKFYY